MSLEMARPETTTRDHVRFARATEPGSCPACDTAAREELARQRRHARPAGTTTASTEPTGTTASTEPTGTRRVATEGAAMTPVIRTTGVTKRYKLGKDNEVVALRGASMEIAGGEMVAIVGPSGSGKSTIMHLIGCLDAPDGGRVFINGRRVDDLKGTALTRVRSTEIGFIFQGFNLIPTMNATDNVALAAEYAGASRGEAQRRAEELLELVGLGDRKRHLPSELSGGQQQRVAIARALVNGPAIVLGDEPTGDLDTATSDEIVALMRKINVETGTTFVLVTHNPEVAASCDRTISMRDGVVADNGLEACRADEAGRRSVREVLFAPLPSAACC
jgi:putative ABC transport system ATP-binding protein